MAQFHALCKECDLKVTHQRVEIFRALLQTIDHPTEGAFRQIRPPVDFADTPASIHRHVPNIGEHTRELLAEAGLDPAQIDALTADGAAVQYRAED